MLGLVALALLGWAAVGLNRAPAPDAATASASSTPTGVTSPPASPTIASPTTVHTGPSNQVPFTNDEDHASGTYAIVSQQWTGNGLLLTVRVSLDQGQQRIGFFSLDNTTAKEYNPTETGGADLDGQRISSGQSLSGTVYFAKPRGDTTVFLTGTSGRQVAALVVKG